MPAVRARWLILLLAALVALVLVGCASVSTTPGPTGLGVQNRVGPFNEATPNLTRPPVAESYCSRPGFTASAIGMTSGFCVAAQDGDGLSVFRTARAGNGESELANGLNPANHVTNEYDGGPGSAFVGSEDVAQKFVGQGPYEDFYTEFKMSPEFADEFDPFMRRYDGGPGIEYEIPYNLIDRFNELTVSRSKVVP